MYVAHNNDRMTGICTSKHTQNLLFAYNLKDTFLTKTFVLLYAPS